MIMSPSKFVGFWKYVSRKERCDFTSVGPWATCCWPTVKMNDITNRLFLIMAIYDGDIFLEATLIFGVSSSAPHLARVTAI